MNSFLYSFMMVFLIGFSLVTFNISSVDAIQSEGKSAWEVMSEKVCGDKLCSEVIYF